MPPTPLTLTTASPTVTIIHSNPPQHHPVKATPSSPSASRQSTIPGSFTVQQHPRPPRHPQESFQISPSPSFLSPGHSSGSALTRPPPPYTRRSNVILGSKLVVTATCRQKGRGSCRGG
ncbi:hypothetical protein E2C01_066538 [Portunus trituberculatus]|uniref:Uncharacterized protein n=1 Tax=Portunus trituberculatus TaxID=210409 RepID=A0A5B7HIF4_PORTR|nr:hypothetical protein [Portunus trituberculatus]